MAERRTRIRKVRPKLKTTAIPRNPAALPKSVEWGARIPQGVFYKGQKARRPECRTRPGLSPSPGAPPTRAGPRLFLRFPKNQPRVAWNPGLNDGRCFRDPSPQEPGSVSGTRHPITTLARPHGGSGASAATIPGIHALRRPGGQDEPECRSRLARLGKTVSHPTCSASFFLLLLLRLPPSGLTCAIAVPSPTA